jgi:hypothetical protein
VVLLTDRAPALLPAPTGRNGLRLDHSQAATTGLLDDLRSDRGMEWVPSSAWLTKVEVAGTAAQLGYDLAVDASGAGRPSRVAAGLDLPGAEVVGQTGLDLGRLLLALGFAAIGLLGIGFMASVRPGGRMAT